MSKIHILDQQTANSIAAGEVVERPASVIKELVENALDAGASVIAAEIRQGGISLIRVSDNGWGMDPEDALLAFGRHATSKLSKIEDLDGLATMGFRGEALASIASVARVRLETRPPAASDGFFVAMAGGEMLDSGAAGCPSGTTISVENLFYNVPARFKFLRKDTTEASLIAEIIERMALARPDVSFRLVSNQQEVLHTPGNNDLVSTVYAVYGKQTAVACLPVSGENQPLKISGLIGRPEIARNSRAQQSIFVNGRLVRSRTASAALDDASGGFLMKGKYPVAVLFIDIPPQLVDVNVHPQKMEIRFWNDSEVYRLVYHAIRNAWLQGSGIAEPLAEDAYPVAETSAPGLTLSDAAPDARAVVGAEPARAPRFQQEIAEAAPSPVAASAQSDTTLDGVGRAGEDGEAVPSAGPWPHPVSGPLPTAVTMTVNDLAGCRLIGKLFQTYILLEAEDDLLLIDQHAAHEKVLYETLVRRHRDNAGRSVPAGINLLVPLVIEVSRSEMQLLKDHQDDLGELGFLFDFFGPSAVALRSLPDSGRLELQPETAFRLALESLRDEPGASPASIADLFDRMACHAAVKAHDTLDDLEISRLLDDLRQLENPYQCPHGRPVIIRLPRRELEKRFKRIV
jgi:DNA mismatch repair protein MutL